MDVARGLPIIHCNFLGYDEQAHRRGPGSNYAHWSLKGIDRAIKRIWKAARRSTRRDYQLWVFADHGQTYTDILRGGQWPQSQRRGERDLSRARATKSASHKGPARGVGGQRPGWLGGGRAQGYCSKPTASTSPREEHKLLVTALGPLGYIYTPTVHPWPRARSSRQATGRRKRAIPLVVTLDDDGQAWAFTDEGRIRPAARRGQGSRRRSSVSRRRRRGTGRTVPSSGCRQLCRLRLEEVRRVAKLSCSNTARMPVPTRKRRAGSALLPADAPVDDGEKGYLRPLDLRAARVCKRCGAHVPVVARPRQKRKRAGTVRVLTYNVHTCIGMDGRLSPRRIARVIAQCDPDIVALQECDVRRRRTDGRDQVREIADELKMEFHFHPAMRLGRGIWRRGAELPSDAAGPIGRLPGIAERPHLEPRGALWVDVKVDGHSDPGHQHAPRPVEPRAAGAGRGAVGRRVARRRGSQGPCILCGDFNALPGSPPYRRLLTRLRDAQLASTVTVRCAPGSAITRSAGSTTFSSPARWRSSASRSRGQS